MLRRNSRLLLPGLCLSCVLAVSPALAFQGPVGGTADSQPAPAVPGGPVPPIPVPGRAAVVVPDVDTVVHEGVVATTANGIVTINVEGADPLSIPVAETVRILLDGRPVRLGDLRRGDRVLVTMDPEGRAALVVTAGRTAPPVRPAAEIPADRPTRVVTRKPSDVTTPRETRRAPLGVVASPSPTTGILIEDIDPQSPLARSGLRRGDYVLRVGKEEIKSPRQFREALLEPAADDDAIEILAWRDGETRTITPNLNVPEAGERDKLVGEHPAGRAWLGFRLAAREDEDAKGILITEIAPGGPAARAGLRAGDVLLTLAGEEITSIDDVSERLGDIGPNQRTDVEIERNGVVSKVDVRVGEVDPEAQTGATDAAPREPEIETFAAENRVAADPLMEQNQRLERLLTELLTEVRGMRRQLGQNAPPQAAEERQPTAPREAVPPNSPAPSEERDASPPAERTPAGDDAAAPAADRTESRTPPAVPGRPRE